MGCPDWPTCFGRLVPPTSVGQLPEDYKEVYSNYRHGKNVRFANYLNAMGMEQTAAAILKDGSIRVEADFNAVKTWVEYINRLVGAAIGLFIVVLFWRSLKFRRSIPSIFFLSLAILLAVIFQGWFGSIVVSTNLTQWTITVHLFLALGIVAALIYLLKLSNPNPGKGIAGQAYLVWILAGCMLALLVQIFWGTEVRGGIDMLASSFPRNEWLEQVGAPFLFHRSFSWVLLFFHLLLWWKLRKTTLRKTFLTGLIILILTTLLSGAGMAYFGVPAFLQPIHLLLASLMLGALFYLLLNLNTRVNSNDYRTASVN